MATKMVKKNNDAPTTLVGIENIRKGLEAGCQLVPLGATFDENLALVDAYEQWGRKSQLWMAWNIGRICCNMAEDESTYGTNTVQRIADHLGKKPRIVFDMQKLYRTYSEQGDIAKLDNTGMGWSQARLLCSVPDASQREEIVQRVKEEHLNVTEMTTLVRQYTATKTPPTKPVKEPTSFDLLKYFQGGNKMLTGVHGDLTDFIKSWQAGIEVMQVADDDLFDTALRSCKDMVSSAEKISELLERFSEGVTWED